MGRTEPTVVKPPAAFRRDARAKRARATLNKVIPAMLSAHPRARRGIERSELVVGPPALSLSSDGKKRDAASNGGGPDVETAGRRKKMRDHHGDEELPHEERSPGTADGPPRITLCVGDALTAAQALLLRSPSLPPPSSQQNQNQKHKGSVSAEASVCRHKKVGVLNMASPLAPGGGFLNGATGPEASLCLRTTLLPALRDEFYRLPELGVVYTPDVLVFRPTTSSSSSSSSLAKWIDDGIGGSKGRGEGSGTTVEGDSREEDILPKNDRWFVDVASAAMLRLPETTAPPSSLNGNENWHHGTKYAHPMDRELAERKMRAVLRVFAAQGCGAVVLGAWGCGVYEGNPVCEIAAAWRRVLGVEVDGAYDGSAQPSGSSKDKDKGKGKVGGLGGKDKKKNPRNKEKEKEREPWGAYISDVVFAIKGRGTATAFARAFGEDYILALPASLPQSYSLSSAASHEEEEEEGQEEDPVQVARATELREKIAQLEIQAAQVRSPHLKVGLETVLAGLRRQLPPEEEEKEEEEEEDDDGSDDGGSFSGLGRERSSETDKDSEKNEEDEGHEDGDEGD